MEQTLAYKTTKNAAYNFLNFAWLIILAFIATPILVHNLGSYDYGLYVLSLTVIAFLSLLEGGIVYGFVKYLAEYLTRNEIDRIIKLINSFLVILTLIGLSGFLLTILTANFFINLLNVDLGNYNQSVLFFYLTGLIFFVTMIGSVFGAIPNALQRFDVVAKWSMGSATAMYILMIGAVLSGYPVLSLLYIYLLISIASSIFYFFYSRKLMPFIRVNYKFDKSIFNPTMKFSFFVFINNIASTALIQIDRFFIAALLGPALVTFYTLPGTIAQKTQSFIASISSILFPLSSDLHARDDKERLKAIYRRVMRIVLILSFALSTIFLVFGYQILFHWLGEEIANQSIAVLYYLIPTYFLLSILIPTINFLLGLGKSPLLARFSIILAILNILLVIVLIPIFGIQGAAAAYLISVLPVILFIRYFEKTIFDLHDSVTFYAKVVAKLFITAAASYAISFYLLLPLITNIYLLIFTLAVAFFLFLALHKLFGFIETEDWQLFKDFFIRSLQKLFIRFKLFEQI